ncbi:MAG TPA: cytochrome c oxidase subunit 3 [Polyangia bacterium]|nr:cytochrome c oxidase subunit 3 [Polyangia bacterium]
MSGESTALGPGRREAASSRGRATATIGMAIFLGAAAMLFAALFFAYAVMRTQAPAWPPVGQAPVPRGALGANTLLLAAASLALRAALAAARRRDDARARTRATAALGLGAAFLAAQIVVWRALVLGGAGPASGIYGSVFFAISGLHALHVFGGLLALAVIVLARGARGVERTERRLALAAPYWDFVLAVWLLFFFVACLR